MLNQYEKHNHFRKNLENFVQVDPHLYALAQLKYQHHFGWWQSLPVNTPGIYILTGGRQVGKTTSCKLLIKHCIEKNYFSPSSIFYLPCDEIFDAKHLGETLRSILDSWGNQKFLLIIDEITYVENWDRVIKALADEGYFNHGLCVLTGSDTLILKEAAMRFPGRRGKAAQTDFHLYPLSFAEYVHLANPNMTIESEELIQLFDNYLQCGGYLRAINDIAEYGKVTESTFQTYEQWIRGDFLRQGKNEDTLLALLRTLLQVGVSQISYSTLTQKMGLVSKETTMDYCRLLERMDILFNLQAFDQNKKMGFPRKARKFHFIDPFIYRTCLNWLLRENQLNMTVSESTIVEACVASHCYRMAKTFYYKGQGEIDIISLNQKTIHAIEVKWSEQLRPIDLKMLKHFKNSFILTKNMNGKIDNITTLPVSEFLLIINSILDE